MEEIENAEEGTLIYDQEIVIDGDEYYTANGQVGVNNYDSENNVDTTYIEEQKDDNKEGDEQFEVNNYDNEDYAGATYIEDESDKYYAENEKDHYYNGNVHTEIPDHDQVENIPTKFNDWCPWEKVYDPASESYYFYNIWTSETTWDEPTDYFEAEDGDNGDDVRKHTAMPDGLILLKAVKKIQSVYRMKRARRILDDQRNLKTLKTQLDIYDGRCDLWLEQGLIYFRKKDYKNTCISLSHAVSNVHIREPEDEELEKKLRPKVRRKRQSEFSAFRRKIPQRSESSKLIARFQAKMRKAPCFSYLKTKFGFALRILGISYFKIWEDSCKPNDLKLAWDTLQIAHTFIENLTHPEFMLILAKCHMCQGSFQGALQLLARVIDNAPTWHRLPEVILLSASLLKTGGKLDQSKQYFTYILDSPYVKGRPYGKYLVNFSLANIYLTENDADGAEEGFSQAFDLFPKHYKQLYCPDDMSLMEWVWHPATWYHTGTMYKKMGLFTLSLEAFNESLQRMDEGEKNDANLWYEIAQSACRSGDTITACNWGDAALKLKPYTNNFSENVRRSLGSWHPGYNENYIKPLDKAATKIQTYMRKKQGREKYLKKKHAISIMQRVGRIWLFWKHKREAEERADRCLKRFIQRRALQALNKWYDYTMTMVKVRNLVGRRIGGMKRSIWFEWSKLARINGAVRRERKKAARTIQRAVRAYNARTALQRARKQKEEQEERARTQLRRFLQRHAVKCLNSWQEYVLKMRQVKDLMKRVLNGTKLRFLTYWKENVDEIMSFKSIQAITIQKEVRRFQKRFEIKIRKERNFAASVIQNRWRVRQAAVLVRMVKFAMQKKVVDAVTSVQAAWRGKLSRRIGYVKHDAATIIQKLFRGNSGRRYVEWKRLILKMKCARKIQRVWLAFINRKKKERILRIKAAIRLQKCIRRHQARKNIETRLTTAKKQWATFVINTKIVEKNIGPETSRAISNGGLLVEKIWQQYKCEAPGKFALIKPSYNSLDSSHRYFSHKEESKINNSDTIYDTNNTHSFLSPLVMSDNIFNNTSDSAIIGGSEEMLKEESLILPLKKTTCSFYVNRSMPHLRPRKRKKKKKLVYTSTKTLPPLIHDHHQYFNSQILQPSDILKDSVRIKKPVPQYTLGEVRDMRALIAKRQQKVATRHDLFHKHGLNKRRLRNSTRKLESLLL
jgi:tetratricopeptide (TPR) repeat protein